MRIKIIPSIIFSALIVLITACSQLPDEYSSGNAYMSNSIEDSSYQELDIVELSDSLDFDSLDAKTSRESIGLDDTCIEEMKKEQAGRYCFDMLDEEDKTLYVELVRIIEKHAVDVAISTKDADELKYVFQCMYNDHPEIYWVDGYAFTKHGNYDNNYITFSGNYIYTVNQCTEFQTKIDSYVSIFLGGINKSASDYDKAKYIYEYLIENTDYNPMASNNQNILSVFIEKESVCQGYAKATQYLFNILGIPSTMVVGTVKNGEGHAWNLVNLDGAYYYIDTTWGDASYNCDGEQLTRTVNYDFLNVTSDDLFMTHSLNNVVTMPYCIATEDNYYVKENLLFQNYDEVQLELAFQNAYINGEENITLKCSDLDIYNKMLYELIDNREIFTYLKTESVTYVNSDANLTISFWL